MNTMVKDKLIDDYAKYLEAKKIFIEVAKPFEENINILKGKTFVENNKGNFKIIDIFKDSEYHNTGIFLCKSVKCGFLRNLFGFNTYSICFSEFFRKLADKEIYIWD